MTTPAVLALEDGTLFRGISVGVEGRSIGEVVFNTAMTGYQEILTDPSYRGQIVTMTYPQIGNYGGNDGDLESERPRLAGFIADKIPDSGTASRLNIANLLTLTAPAMTTGSMVGSVAGPGQGTSEDLVDMKEVVAYPITKEPCAISSDIQNIPFPGRQGIQTQTMTGHRRGGRAGREREGRRGAAVERPDHGARGARGGPDES